MTTKTKTALLARGIDTHRADALITANFTLQKLQQLNDAELSALNLTPDQMAAVRAGTRPPIPENTLLRILSKSAWTCCICMESHRSVIVHHIHEWSESRSHDEENLVVLCCEHHENAHAHFDLALNLTSDRIRAFKRHWEQIVSEREIQSLLVDIKRDSSQWDYINIQKLFRTLSHFDVDLTKLRGYRTILASGLIDIDGFPTEGLLKRSSENSYYILAGQPLATSIYLEDALFLLLSRTDVLDLNKYWIPRGIRAMVQPGTYIRLTGAHRFKADTSVEGIEPRRVYRSARSIELSFYIDAWYALSSSSRAVHLSGNYRVTSIGVVRDVSYSSDCIKIQTSCVAIGIGMEENIPHYSPEQFGGKSFEEEFEEFENEDEDGLNGGDEGFVASEEELPF